jgi:hypothetical protein
MASLGLVLAGTYATGSVGVGGLMVTVYVVALTLCAPLTGRLLDRVGPATGTPYLLGFAALALSGLAAAVILKASALPLLLLAGLSGVFAAGSSAAMRSLLNQVVPARLLTPALSINSIAERAAHRRAGSNRRSARSHRRNGGYHGCRSIRRASNARDPVGDGDRTDSQQQQQRGHARRRQSMA